MRKYKYRVKELEKFIKELSRLLSSCRFRLEKATDAEAITRVLQCQIVKDNDDCAIDIDLRSPFPDLRDFYAITDKEAFRFCTWLIANYLND